MERVRNSGRMSFHPAIVIIKAITEYTLLNNTIAAKGRETREERHAPLSHIHIWIGFSISLQWPSGPQQLNSCTRRKLQMCSVYVPLILFTRNDIGAEKLRLSLEKEYIQI